MTALAPFEPAPLLAVAVSGGRDSLALALLADRWARARGGRVIGFTVDHGLRPEAAAEAAQVGAWLTARGIAHHILTREGPVPVSDIQAAARQARYALLRAACRDHGILHLLVAHHLEDQAETLLLRLARGSGVAGLAGMASLVETGDCRLLRPLLGVSRRRLEATLRGCGQPWIDDPSNRNPAYARVRLRDQAAGLAALGLDPPRLAGTARQLGMARAALERAADRLLAEAVSIHPAGFARMDHAVLARAPIELALRAVAAVLATIGGTEYPPRFDRLERLWRRLSGPEPARAATLGGCRLLPMGEGILVLREAAAIAGPAPLETAGILWDGRFTAKLVTGSSGAGTFRIAALGPAGVASIGVAAGHCSGIPRRIRPVLPGVWSDRGLVAVPHLGWAVPDAPVVMLRFQPKRAITSTGFTVV
ncbi:MAG TPA: tRNA lysidine(34) synthetase TilS [Stellaceae bacterium]|nr:tRNA lysidine(34) synthetase TilS [Stellaceae bacterium]